MSKKRTHDRLMPGWSELIEDAIGVNLRGLATLWATIRRPSDLFNAARTMDWNAGEFSPPLRVWMFLLAIMMLLQFIWAGPDTAFGQFVRSAITVLETSTFGSNPERAVEAAVQTYVFIYPSVLLSLYLFAGLIVRIWGKATTTVVGIRLMFAAILPGMLVTLLTLTTFGLVPSHYTMQYMLGSTIAVFAVDFTTVWRGLSVEFSKLSRLWRSGLMALVSLMVYSSASTVTFNLMASWITQ